MNIFDLVAKITLDTKEFEEKASGAASAIKNGLATAAKIGATAVTAVSTATAAMAGTLIKGTSEVATYGDNIDKMSQKMGLSAEAYQEWDAIMQHSGTSIESLQAGMKTLANAVENGNDAFQRLGISQEQIASMSNEELFSATITALQNVDNETERTYLAGQLLGRGATELGALLNTSAEDTQAMRDKVHELGGVMSNDAVKASAAFKDSLQDMQTSLKGLGRGMMSDFLPSVTSIMDGLTEIFSGNGESGISMITSGISDFVDNITMLVPRLSEQGQQIIDALLTAINDNLPQLIDAAVQIIMQLTNGIIEHLPDLIQAALQIILALANGITESLPELIPTIVDVVLQIVDTLTNPDTLSTLVDASIAIMIALANGLIEALPELIQKAPVIISNLVTAIVENVPKLLEAALQIIVTLATGIINNLGQIFSAGRDIVSKVVEGIRALLSKLTEIGGKIIDTVKTAIKNGFNKIIEVGKNLVQGLWSGISNSLSWIKEKISGWVGNVMSFIKRLFGIGSPSKLMRDEVGKFMAQGIGVGFEDEMKNVEKVMQKAMPNLSAITPEVDGGIFGGINNAYSTQAITSSETANSKRDRLIEMLEEYFPELIDTIQSLRIYLDTGVLVGAMTPGIDRSLGRETVYRMRAN